MTVSDRDRRHRWAEMCERLADWLLHFAPDIEADDAADLRSIAAYLRDDRIAETDLQKIAAYLRAPLAREDAATKEER